MTRTPKQPTDNPVNTATVLGVAFWLLAMGTPYALGIITAYGPSYDLHRTVLSMEGWGWLFMIAGVLTITSLFWRRPVIKFTARAVPSVIIMIWTVLWYFAALEPGFPGYSAVPTYTFVAATSILTFYAPAIGRRWGAK